MARFPQDYTKEKLAELVIFHRNESIEKGTKLLELKDRYIKVSKELSDFKKKLRIASTG